MSTAWRIAVDTRRCIGTSICAGTAPEHFRLVDGLSTPLADVVAPAEVILDAADSCPGRQSRSTTPPTIGCSRPRSDPNTPYSWLPVT